MSDVKKIVITVKEEKGDSNCLVDLNSQNMSKLEVLGALKYMHDTLTMSLYKPANIEHKFKDSK